MGAENAKTIVIVAEAIAAEVVFWPGWSLMDMRMSPPRSGSLHILDFMSDMFVEFLNLVHLIMNTSQSISGDLVKDLM